KTKIQETIDIIRPRLNDLKKQHDDQLKRFDPLNKRLGEAMAKSDPALIKLYLKAAKPEIPWAGEMLTSAGKMMKILEKLEVDQVSREDFQSLEQATKELSELKGKLEKNFASFKAGEDKANDVLSKYQKSGGEFAEEWATMQSTIHSHLDNANWRINQSTMVVKKAHQAVTDRDKDELGKLLVISKKYQEGNPTHQDVVKQFEAFTSRAKASGLDPHAKDQLDREMPGLKKLIEEAAAIEARIIKNTQEIQELKIKPLDAKKAAAALKIPQLAGELKGALELSGAALEKALDTIGKKAKPPQSGKDMVAALKAAKLL
ncbi:MAG TPA: hypothetical protein VMZ27_12760, partial [Candidatus Saccharimonadales bacterium]|nr:hypothetical protein [Candidatus Saccharimonadales bacterium]